ncbi:Golgi transport complex subunit COG4 [Sporobolomyces salmoneus]|uniref:Golgi transport complex subunit COG4 n=1 Tax=Sporobolomyces salmoneus TaxID=183962 RepID=UPI00317EBF1B
MSVADPPPPSLPVSSPSASPPLGPPSSLSASTLLTRQDIEHHLSLLTAQESTLDERLAGLISSRTRLTSQLKALESLRPVIGGIQGEALQMASEIGAVAETAERVGAKVRGLDEEQSRVKASIDVVQAVQDLKTAIANLDASIQKQDWEAATRAMQRARSIDQEIVRSGFAEAVVPTSDLPSTPTQTLEQFHATLLETFLTCFKAAAEQNDNGNIGRFFKLFPMIEEEAKGLEVYADWVGGIVRSKTGALSSKSQSPTHFSSLLTTLFESIALIISQHQPIVSKYYGPTSMLSVARSLMIETDRLGVKVVSNWEEERKVRTRLLEISQHRFQGVSGLRKIQTTTSNVTNKSPMLGQNGFENQSMGQQQQQMQQQTEIDPKETDAVLQELNLMSGRWQLLRRFLYASLLDDEESKPSTLPTKSNNLDPEATPQQGADGEDEEEEETKLDLVEDSQLGKTISRQLKEVYIPLESWYLRSAIERAHQVDELDLTSTPTLSSSLDDIFYILKKTLYRLINTGSITAVVLLCRELKTLLDENVTEIWRFRIETALKDLQYSGGTGSSGLGGIGGGGGGTGSGIGIGGVSAAAMGGMAAIGGGGRAREEEKERREKESRAIFIVYLNNLDTAASYTSRLHSELVNSDLLSSIFFLDSELSLSTQSLSNLLPVTAERFKSVLKGGLDSLFNQLVRPRLRPLLSEVYHGTSYRLDENGYDDAEFTDEVRKRFVRSWDNLLAGYRDSLSETNFNLFFSTAVNVLVRPWESMIRGMKFTELGALRLDHDIRSILSYLSTQSPLSSGSLRESFSRLQQIASLLCCDSKEEAEEVVSAAATGGRLTKGEVEAVWSLRI